MLFDVNRIILQAHEDWQGENPGVEVLSLDRLDTVGQAIGRLLAADRPASGVPPLGIDAYGPLQTALSTS